MHISQLYLYTTSPREVIHGNIEISHEGVTVKVELSEKDRHRIQQIVVDAFIAEREKIAAVIRENTPAFIALEAPKHEAEDAEFDEIPY